MSNTRKTRQSPFQAFTLCPDCHTPVVQFCPWCGRDIHTEQHGGVTFYIGGRQYNLMCCLSCLNRLKAGGKPPLMPVAKLN